MARTQRAAIARNASAMAEPHRPPAAAVAMIATMGLALSTLVAVAAVSIGLARADASVFGMVADSASLATALLIAFLVVVMGGLTAILAGGPER